MTLPKLPPSLRTLALCTGLCATAASSALTINLNDIGGVTGTPAENGFRQAATYWESVLTNNATINIDVGYSSLPPNVLGGTSSTLYEIDIATFGFFLGLGASSSNVDALAAAHFPAMDGNGAITMITPGYVDEINKLGIDNSKRVLDGDGSYNNLVIAASGANLRALGLAPFLPNTADAKIEFSSDFPFDFSPGNGIAPGSYDFIAVAIHEIGHALGFISGADDYDFLGRPNGPLAGLFDDYPVNDTWWGYALDLFRYSGNPGGLGGGGPMLDWAPGSDAYFSLDGGSTAFMDGFFSTGSFNGDESQASHWKANGTCANFLGVMNPYICNGKTDVITALDLAAFDAIGWNLRDDIANDRNYRFDTANIPEPSGVALLALALAGMRLTRRRVAR